MYFAFLLLLNMGCVGGGEVIITSRMTLGTPSDFAAVQYVFLDRAFCAFAAYSGLLLGCVGGEIITSTTTLGL